MRINKFLDRLQMWNYLPSPKSNKEVPREEEEGWIRYLTSVNWPLKPPQLSLGDNYHLAHRIPGTVESRIVLTDEKLCNDLCITFKYMVWIAYMLQITKGCKSILTSANVLSCWSSFQWFLILSCVAFSFFMSLNFFLYLEMVQQSKCLNMLYALAPISAQKKNQTKTQLNQTTPSQKNPKQTKKILKKPSTMGWFQQHFFEIVNIYADQALF